MEEEITDQVNQANETDQANEANRSDQANQIAVDVANANDLQLFTDLLQMLFITSRDDHERTFLIHQLSLAPRTTLELIATLRQDFSSDMELEDVRYGLCPESFSLLPTFQIPNADSQICEKCTPCLNNFQIGEVVIRLPKCHHTFHKSCLETWSTQYKAVCPNCRTEIDGDKRIIE